MRRSAHHGTAVVNSANSASGSSTHRTAVRSEYRSRGRGGAVQQNSDLHQDGHVELYPHKRSIRYGSRRSRRYPSPSTPRSAARGDHAPARRQLTRLTPGNSEALLFDGVPWAAGSGRARRVHAAHAIPRCRSAVESGDLLAPGIGQQCSMSAGHRRAVDSRGWVRRWRKNSRPICTAATCRSNGSQMAGMTFAELPTAGTETSPWCAGCTGAGTSPSNRCPI